MWNGVAHVKMNRTNLIEQVLPLQHGELYCYDILHVWHSILFLFSGPMSVWWRPGTATAALHWHDGDSQDTQGRLLCQNWLWGKTVDTLEAYITAFYVSASYRLILLLFIWSLAHYLLYSAPFFLPMQDFYERYQFLMGPKQPDLGLQIKLFLGNLGFGNDDIQIGKTKVQSFIEQCTHT